MRSASESGQTIITAMIDTTLAPQPPPAKTQYFLHSPRGGRRRYDRDDDEDAYPKVQLNLPKIPPQKHNHPIWRSLPPTERALCNSVNTLARRTRLFDDNRLSFPL